MSADQQRRLSAILMLDVVGYSRMMAEDEGGALARLMAARGDVVDPQVAAHNGRIVKLMGDGALVEFASVTDAVRCAVAIQSDMARREDGLQLRIGINLGEVIVDGGDIYGDGVNVAARVEALADPGGISVTAAVVEHIKAQLPVSFEDAGEVEVKNLPNPVRVFHARGAGGARPVAARPSSRRPAIAFLVVAILCMAGLAAWWMTSQNAETSAALMPSGGTDDRPSVIVMPFDNLSGDPEQAYFSDGMTDNLITDLSQVGGLMVIARNTSFSFRDRGEATDPQSVGRALGVRYVVEGSVQRAGGHVRINTRLVDAGSGFQVWAGRLDREFTDLFALQDAVTADIIDALHVELTLEEKRRLSKRYTNSLEAYDLYLRAYEEVWRFNNESRIVAQGYLTEALEIDPDFTLARGLLATTYTNRNGVSLENNTAMLDHAYELAARAISEDPSLPQVQGVMGLVRMFRQEFAESEAAFNAAIKLDPNNADNHAMRAWSRYYSGEPESALRGFEHAFLLNPRAPFPYLNAIAEVHFSLGNYEESLRYNTEAIQRNPEALRQRLFLAAVHAELGNLEDAEWEVEEALALQPEMRLTSIRFIAPYKDPAALERLTDALRRAGLPE